MNTTDGNEPTGEHEVLHPDAIDYGRATPYTAIGHAPTQATEVNALIAMVLAIASWMVIPIVGAVAALFVASNAKRSIHASNGALAGLGIARGAQAVAWANLICCALFLLVVVALFDAIF